jgi:hypothetical protein
MREIKVKIEGLEPGLLMHNVASMKSSSGGSKKSIPTSEEEALAACYWLDSKRSALAIPGRNIHASFVNAGGKYKVGKNTLTSLLTSSLHVAPELISLGKKTYSIDVRPVVVQKARILRARPLIHPWTANFSIFFDEEWISLKVMQDTMPELIKTAGKLIGVLDYRPAKKGPFGMYRLVRYEMLPMSQIEEVDQPEIIGFDQAA